jgi:hypothetical protein
MHVCVKELMETDRLKQLAACIFLIHFPITTGCFNSNIMSLSMSHKSHTRLQECHGPCWFIATSVNCKQAESWQQETGGQDATELQKECKYNDGVYICMNEFTESNRSVHNKTSSFMFYSRISFQILHIHQRLICLENLQTIAQDHPRPKMWKADNEER